MTSLYASVHAKISQAHASELAAVGMPLDFQNPASALDVLGPARRGGNSRHGEEVRMATSF
jgi:hypothetical protein